MKRINWQIRRLTEALKRRDLIKNWLPKAYVLEKEMQGKMIGKTNWHKG